MINEKHLLALLNLWKKNIAERGTHWNVSQWLDRVIEEINTMPKVGEWIPCSERLPEENEMSDYYDAVIVTLDSGRVVNGCYRNIDEEWWVDAEDGKKHFVNATGHVIAWQPLPAPYNADLRKERENK